MRRMRQAYMCMRSSFSVSTDLSQSDTTSCRQHTHPPTNRSRLSDNILAHLRVLYGIRISLLPFQLR